MSDPKCSTCRWCTTRQCTRAWPDTTETGRTERVIRINEKAGELYPAHHVWRWYCHGTGFQSFGLPQGAKTS